MSLRVKRESPKHLTDLLPSFYVANTQISKVNAFITRSFSNHQLGLYLPITFINKNRIRTSNTLINFRSDPNPPTD